MRGRRRLCDGYGSAALPASCGVVRAVAPDGNGGWYIGGDFRMAGGRSRRNLAQFDAGAT